MSIDYRSLVSAVLAVSAVAMFASDASAATVKKVRKPHREPVAVSRMDDIYGVHEDFFPGAIQDPGSSNRYFSDTRRPHYLLGPGYFQRNDEPNY